MCVSDEWTIASRRNTLIFNVHTVCFTLIASRCRCRCRCCCCCCCSCCYSWWWSGCLQYRLICRRWFICRLSAIATGNRIFSSSRSECVCRLDNHVGVVLAICRFVGSNCGCNNFSFFSIRHVPCYVSCPEMVRWRDRHIRSRGKRWRRGRQEEQT